VFIARVLKNVVLLGESDGVDDDEDLYWNQTVPDEQKTSIGVTDTVTAPEGIVENFAEKLADSLDKFMADDPDEAPPKTVPSTAPQDGSPPEFPPEISVAPGEGKTRIYLSDDPEAPWTCFPTIFAGKSMSRFLKPHPDGKLYLSEFCKLLMRHVDSRFRQVPEAIFFFMKLLQEKRVFSQVSIACRKGEGKGPQNADQVLNGNWQKWCEEDKCYRFLKDVRFSPPYWAKFKSEVYAMVEQLGSPQWFFTISCAESHWMEILGGISGHTVAEVEAMTHQEKCDIVVKYPAELARIFQHRINLVLKHLVPANKQGFLGEVLNRVVRYEFQKRGSPHIHSLIWLTPPPKESPDTTEEVDHALTYKDVKLDWAKLDCEEAKKFFPEWAVEFSEVNDNQKMLPEAFGKWIDKFISCSTDCRCEPDSERCFKNQKKQEPKGKINHGCEIPVNYQYHRHSSTYCQREKGGTKYCKFGFPKPPMPESRLFLPLEYYYPTLAKCEEEIAVLLKMAPEERPEDCNLEELQERLKPLKDSLEKRKKTALAVSNAIKKWLNEFDRQKPEEKDIVISKFSGDVKESFRCWLDYVIDATGLSDHFKGMTSDEKTELYCDSISVDVEEPTVFIKRKLDAVVFLSLF